MRKIKNFTDMKFNNWTVIDRDPQAYLHKSPSQWWLCQCDCGIIQPKQINSLQNGKSTQCRECCDKKQRLNLKIDEKFGKWQIIKHYKHKYWECKCECGTISYIQGHRLKAGYSTHCKNCSGRKYCGSISGTYFGGIKAGAEQRNLEFHITIEDIWDLFVQQQGKCALTGRELIFANNTREEKIGITTASLDRIDSSKGYTIDNIQWIYKYLNAMKLDHSQDYFISLCKDVAYYNRNAPKKIWNENEIEKLSIYLHDNYIKITVSSGYFNPTLHSGHISLINESCIIGDVFVMIINGNKSTKKKYGFAVDSEQRKELLAQFSNVDFVIDYDSDDMSEAIKILRPNYFCKGGSDRCLVNGTIKEAEKIAAEEVGTIIHDGVGGYNKIKSNKDIIAEIQSISNSYNIAESYI